MNTKSPRERIVESLAGEPSDAGHYEAIGRFVTAYAGAEGMLHFLARKLLGLSDEKGRIIFSGMRLSDIADRVRGILRAENKDDDDEAKTIDDCLTQLGHISDQRHKIVHRNSFVSSGSITVTNAYTARNLKTAEVDNFSREILNDMQQDCSTVFLKLYKIVNPEQASQIASLEKVIAGPWRYKPVPPKPKNQLPRKAPKGQKRRPHASQA